MTRIDAFDTNINQFYNTIMFGKSVKCERDWFEPWTLENIDINTRIDKIHEQASYSYANTIVKLKKNKNS